MRRLLFLSLLLCASSAMATAPKDALVVQESSDIPTLDPGATYDNVVDAQTYTRIKSTVETMRLRGEDPVVVLTSLMR